MDAQDFCSIQKAYMDVYEAIDSEGRYVRNNSRPTTGKPPTNVSPIKPQATSTSSPVKPTKPTKAVKKPESGSVSAPDAAKIRRMELAKKYLTKNKQTFTTSSSHTSLMKDMLKHQKQQKQLW